MYSGLLIILLPLIFGYLITIKQATWRNLINRTLSIMVYVILFIMGVSLAFLQNLQQNLSTIFIFSLSFFVIIFICNSATLILLSRQWKWRLQPVTQSHKTNWRMLFDSLQLCAIVLVGFLVGLTHWSWLKNAHQLSEIALIFLLFLVGIQLRNSGMSLRQITMNRRGIIIAFMVAVSSLIGGVIAALCVNLPVKTGLAIASGFGWYSLSGIMLTDAFGPIIGTTAFFNDLFRELMAIMLIPALTQRNPMLVLGNCGATSMDFTLPILQRSGSIQIVPAAIVHGFLLSLLAPVLMAFFAR